MYVEIEFMELNKDLDATGSNDSEIEKWIESRPWFNPNHTYSYFQLEDYGVQVIRILD